METFQLLEMVVTAIRQFHNSVGGRTTFIETDFSLQNYKNDETLVSLVESERKQEKCNDMLAENSDMHKIVLKYQ